MRHSFSFESGSSNDEEYEILVDRGKVYRIKNYIDNVM